MLKNYFKTAFRNLWRSRQFTLINTAGLVLGTAVFLFIIEYVAFELAANRFNKNYETLYRASVQYKDGHTDYNLAPGFAPILKEKFPAIEKYTRTAENIGAGVLTYNKNGAPPKAFRENSILYVDGNFLDMITFPIVDGSPSLKEPATLALSEPVARKIFGKDDAIGKVVTVSNQFGNTPYTVKAVYKLPPSSDIKGEVLLSLHTLESAANRDDNDWADPNTLDAGFTNIYLQLGKTTNATKLAAGITSFLRASNPGSKDDMVALQPFKNLHLAPNFDYPFQTYGNLLMVVVFGGIALLILLIGWVNYINLSIAQSLHRAREVGVRKVLGASRYQLMIQYLTETLILTVSSTLLAVFLVKIFQGKFNDFAGKELSLSFLNQGWIWVAGVLLLVVGSVASGSYVAFVLTRFKPITTIRGKVQANVKGLTLRKSLVVFQFTISVIFIIATAIIYKQLKYMQQENLGMNLNQLLVLQGPTVSSEGQAARNVAFKNSLAQLPFVKKQAASNNVPGVGYNFFTNGITKFNDPQKDDERKSYAMFICDEHFFDTYGVQLKEGRTFTNEEAERSWNNLRKVIINESAARALGFPDGEAVIGKKISWGEAFEVIGVVKDYHHLSLREDIKPTIYLGSVSFSYFTVQTDSRNMQAKIGAIRDLYNRTFPGNPFEYFFADQKYDQQYITEQKLGNVFIAAACIAIFIACLGLYGLAAFSAKQRVKEIGIRKVLGAGVADITALLSKDFLFLVLIAIGIAIPVAWWAMQKWLQDFAYQTSISWWIFFVSGFAAIAIALLTISYQAIKAALANPVKSLRTE